MDQEKSIASFAELIDAWGGASALGGAIGARAGTVRQWKNRNRIPPDRWLAVVHAAEQRGDPRITVDLMARLAAQAIPA